MKSGYSVLWAIAAVFLSSCSSVYFFTIETQQPAPVTFPGGRPNIVIVNNALPQPDSIGFFSHTFIPKSKGENINSITPPKIIDLKDLKESNDKSIAYDTIQTGLRLSPGFPDSLLQLGTQVFAKRINESGFFSDVLLYDGNLRQDNEWLKTSPISGDVIRNICREADAQAIISIDKLLFYYTQDLHPGYYNTMNVTFAGILTGTCTVYLEERAGRLTSVPFKDTIADHLVYYEALDSLMYFRETPEYFLKELTLMSAEKIAEYFIPTWEQTDRILHTGLNARMKDALAYSKKGLWKDALKIWMTLFESEKKAKNKAKLAGNIAVAWEMQDDLSSAMEWLIKSEELYKTAYKDIPEKDVEWLHFYKSELDRRIKNDEILDLQYSGE